MRYDLYYIKNMSLWMDLKIIINTCGVFLSSWSKRRAARRMNVRPIFAVEPPRLQVKWRPEDAAQGQVVPLVQYAREWEESVAAEAPKRSADLPAAQIPVKPESR
jgi:hypothetical protein